MTISYEVMTTGKPAGMLLFLPATHSFIRQQLIYPFM